MFSLIILYRCFELLRRREEVKEKFSLYLHHKKPGDTLSFLVCILSKDFFCQEFLFSHLCIYFSKIMKWFDSLSRSQKKSTKIAGDNDIAQNQNNASHRDIGKKK